MYPHFSDIMGMVDCISISFAIVPDFVFLIHTPPLSLPLSYSFSDFHTVCQQLLLPFFSPPRTFLGLWKCVNIVFNPFHPFVRHRAPRCIKINMQVEKKSQHHYYTTARARPVAVFTYHSFLTNITCHINVKHVFLYHFRALHCIYNFCLHLVPFPSLTLHLRSL